MNTQALKDFIENAQLYEVYKTLNLAPSNNNQVLLPYDFDGLTFDYTCCVEENKHTSFKLKMSNKMETDAQFERLLFGVPSICISDDKLDYTFHLIGRCQSCSNYQVEFLINVYTDDHFPSSWVDRIANGYDDSLESALEIPVFIRKVGIKPEVDVNINKTIKKFFDRESETWYFKAVSAINKNFGIGSLAYFRRIIEKELIHIIEEIKSLPDAHEIEIQSLLDEHNKRPEVSTIYENIFAHLPNSLKLLGDNPIKLLYNQTSDGLHSLTEQEALSKSQAIQEILEFVILKIYEERSNIKSVKDAIKGLKG